VKLGESSTGLADYLTPATHLAFIEPASLDEEFSGFARDGVDALSPLLAKCAAVVGLSDLDEASTLFDPAITETTWDTRASPIIAAIRRRPGRP